MMPFLPVLAFDLREVLAIIIPLLWVLGWFVKAVKGQGENAPPARPQNPRQAQSEIEAFLKEIAVETPKRPPAKPNQPARPPAKAAKKPQNKPPAAPKPTKAAKPGAALAEQHLASSNLGSGLRSHVSTFMETDRVAAEVRQDLKSRIGDEVRSDLGAAMLTSDARSTLAPAPVHPLVTLLRDPQGVRQAIALQEILQPPKGRRHR